MHFLWFYNATYALKDPKMLSLNQLEHLLALDETRHFAKAADKVHLSQPAFSRSIQSLERQTGMPLFERKGREIKPTPSGAYLIARSREVVSQARSLERDLQLYQSGEIGSLAFGVGPFPSATLAGPVTQDIRQKFPNTRMRVEVISPQGLFNRLVKEDIEFYVADSSAIPPAPYLQIEPLVQQQAHLYARKNHPLLRKKHTYADAWKYGIATVKLPEEVKGILAQLAGEERPQDLAAAFECDDVNLLCQMALQTDTVVVLTEQVHASSSAGKQLARLKTSDFPPLRTQIAIVTLKSRTLSPVAQFAIEAFRLLSQSLPGVDQAI